MEASSLFSSRFMTSSRGAAAILGRRARGRGPPSAWGPASGPLPPCSSNSSSTTATTEGVVWMRWLRSIGCQRITARIAIATTRIATITLLSAQEGRLPSRR